MHDLEYQPTLIKNASGTLIYEQGSWLATNKPSNSVYIDGDEVRLPNLCFDYIQAVSFEDANLRGLCLTNATFVNVDFKGADFTDAILGETTFIGCSNLSSAIGLDTVQFQSSIAFDKGTLDLNIDGLPDAFLAGCGYTPDQITTVRHLHQNLANERS